MLLKLLVVALCQANYNLLARRSFPDMVLFSALLTVFIWFGKPASTIWNAASGLMLSNIVLMIILVYGEPLIAFFLMLPFFVTFIVFGVCLLENNRNVLAPFVVHQREDDVAHAYYMGIFYNSMRLVIVGIPAGIRFWEMHAALWKQQWNWFFQH